MERACGQPSRSSCPPRQQQRSSPAVTNGNSMLGPERAASWAQSPPRALRDTNTQLLFAVTFSVRLLCSHSSCSTREAKEQGCGSQGKRNYERRRCPHDLVSASEGVRRHGPRCICRGLPLGAVLMFAKKKKSTNS